MTVKKLVIFFQRHDPRMRVYSNVTTARGPPFLFSLYYGIGFLISTEGLYTVFFSLFIY